MLNEHKTLQIASTVKKYCCIMICVFSTLLQDFKHSTFSYVGSFHMKLSKQGFGIGLVLSYDHSIQLYLLYYYTPRKLCLWEGILFSRPSVRTNERPKVSVTFCFLNIFRIDRWNFIKLCKNIHMYKANTTYKN